MRVPSPSLDQRTRASLQTIGKFNGPWLVRGVRAVLAATFEQVWQGGTPFQILPVIPGALQGVSTAPADNLAGTGATHLKIWYLNSRFELQLATVVMGGITRIDAKIWDVVNNIPTVRPVTDALRVLRVEVAGVGSTGANIGKITVSIATVEQCVIPTIGSVLTSSALFNVGSPGAFTVPLGFVATLDGFSCDPTGPSCVLQVRPPEFPFKTVVASGNGISVSPMDFRTPMSWGPGTDMRLVYESLAAQIGTVMAPMAKLLLSPTQLSVDVQFEALVPDLPDVQTAPQAGFESNPLPAPV